MWSFVYNWKARSSCGGGSGVDERWHLELTTSPPLDGERSWLLGGKLFRDSHDDDGRIGALFYEYCWSKFRRGSFGYT